MRYRKATTGIRIPVPGDKIIEEFFGAATTGDDAFSLARMDAPPGWTEPAQRPTFGELTIMIEGTLLAFVDDECVEIAAGEVLHVEPNAHVRYENPGPGNAHYWALCMPAFTLDRARRDS